MKYILVHGSWQSSQCWNQLAPHLREEGHEVECIDLPGCEPLPCQVTYNDYYRFVEEAVLRQTEPVALVAHSMSGIIVGPLADRYSDRVAHAFFISAFLPEKGKSLVDAAMQYGNREFAEILRGDSTNNIDSVTSEGAKKFFFHDCSAEVVKWAVAQLRPQPSSPIKTPIDWEDSLATREKRTYIICEKDRVIHPTAQRDMARLHPCREVSFESGHFPFLSHPEEITKILTSIL